MNALAFGRPAELHAACKKLTYFIFVSVRDAEIRGFFLKKKGGEGGDRGSGELKGPPFRHEN